MDTLPLPAQEGNTPQYKVYRLINRNKLPFYVGITINLFERYKQHMRCDGSNEQKDAIIQEDLQADFITRMERIELADTLEQALARELHWIQYHLEQGYTLTNIVGMPTTSTQPKRIKRKKVEAPPTVQIPWYAESWEVADYAVGNRNGRFVTVENATDAEFDAWLVWNEIDPSYIDINFMTGDWFTRRCMIINDAFDQGHILELADGRSLGLEKFLPEKEGE